MTNNKKGFTIIEVVLVLAIAGLIFLMVFIALPALQRSQRNTRRRQDMARILSAVQEYQANNNGKVPCQDKTGQSDDCFNGNKNGQLANFIEKYIIAQKVDKWTTSREGKGSAAIPETTAGNCYEQFCDPDGTSYLMTKFDNWGDTSIKKDTDGTKYFEWTSGDTNYETAQKAHEIMLANSAKCDSNSEGKIRQTTGKSEVALMYVLEGGAVYCGDNQ